MIFTIHFGGPPLFLETPICRTLKPFIIFPWGWQGVQKAGIPPKGSPAKEYSFRASQDSPQGGGFQMDGTKKVGCVPFRVT